MRPTLGKLLGSACLFLAVGISCWFRTLEGLSTVAELLRGNTVQADGRITSGLSLSLTDTYSVQVRPALARYCFACHSEKVQKGGLDLARFNELEDVRKDLSIWELIVEKLENGEMPPKSQPQPVPEERRRLVAAIHRLLDAEAHVQAGDPGRVVLRRLSNAEYDYTIQDLTGTGLQPAREFPADGAAGEGFSNTGDALAMSDMLLDKYLAAANDIAAHAILLPDGFRFSASKSTQDWSNEVVAKLQAFYNDFAEREGRIPLQRYLAALFRYRGQGKDKKISLEVIARKESLSAKYLASLWQMLNTQGKQPSFALDPIRALWRETSSQDPSATSSLIAEITTWQHELWSLLYRGRDQDRITDLGFQPWQSPEYPFAVRRAKGEERRRLEREAAEFRRWFPLSLCFNEVTVFSGAETIALWLYYREDEPLCRLMLDDRQKEHLDRLWAELHYISRDALKIRDGFDLVAESGNLAKVEKQRAAVWKRAEEFERELLASEPRHLQALLEFAARAHRRPLEEKEKHRFLDLYAGLRRRGASHQDAFRTLLARVLVSPWFLYRVERAPAGREAARVSDGELASRLSYFLWSGPPDAELSRLAGEGKLHEDEVLREQVQRLLKDDRVRRLAVEFGMQWLQLRGFDDLRDKNDKLFPEFDTSLRRALYEEAIRVFQDLFQNDRSLLELIGGDATFLNEELAKYYGVADVRGPEWRRVKGVQRYGRGGVLTWGCLLAKQASASRTSPVLRGHWITETLLGEKTPQPPPIVPRLPEEESADGGLSMRRLLEKHVQAKECAVCHVRIDPFGLALERYDAVGRLRDKDWAGRPIDVRARLQDGTEFEGIDGLRRYLKSRRQRFVQTFCRRLLGYALGRAVTLSDRPLLEAMSQELRRRDYRASAAVLAVVRSKPFQCIRGRDVAEKE